MLMSGGEESGGRHHPLSPLLIKKETAEYAPTSPHTMSPTTTIHTDLDFNSGGGGQPNAFTTLSPQSKPDLLGGYGPTADGGLGHVRRPSGYDSSSSPDSPDRHFCSSTTHSAGDLNHTRSEVFLL